MTLVPGTRVGAYEVRGALGAGAMGEVYRARDTKLERDVALKILPEPFASDADRLARFAREARTLAALNHPHIAQIYGIEESNGTRALVMELVNGETLAERIGRGPLPLHEAVAIARQIAAALDAAHEKGIVHRDLKPANILLRPDGVAKVLDFGLSKAIVGAAEEGAARSPTVTAAATVVGAVLGTPAYMSPEQARGQPVDRRTDVWAFGCVLFEMLTAYPAFGGETVSDTLARILERDPDWSRLPDGTPPALRRLLRRCLQKDPRLRHRDMGDAQIELDEGLDPLRDMDAAPRPSRIRPAVLVAGTGVVLCAAALAALAAWNLKPAQPHTVARFSHVLPGETGLAVGWSASTVAIAPDGSTIVYTAGGSLYRRALGELDAVAIRGTDGSPAAPFFAPDGQTVGFWDSAAGELRRVPLAGGTPVPLTRATTPYGVSWEPDDTILYGQQDGIWRVAASGGPPEPLIQIEAGELLYGPRLLHEGRAVLFSLVERASMRGQASAWDTARVLVQMLDTGERREIIRGSDARVLRTGHLTYAVGATLFAVPFDLARLELRGAPIAVAEKVQRAVRGSAGQGGSANYDISRSGTLVYVPEFALPANLSRRLVAVDLGGKAEPMIEDERDYWRPRISPDGTRVAVEVHRPDLGAQVWIVDLQHGTSTPLAAEGDNGYPAWTPDGQSVVYRHQEVGLSMRAADGRGAARILLGDSHATVRVTDISRDGVVALASGSPQDDIRTLDLKSGAVSDFLATPAKEHMASFSPDGKWLAYTSNESGRDEIWVRRFPRTDDVARLVSDGGGAAPMWARDGSALYYRSASGELHSVPVTLGDAIVTGRARPLFRVAGVFRMSGTAAAYDVHPDGKRFVMVTEPEVDDDGRPRPQITVVLNWFDELARLTAAN